LNKALHLTAIPLRFTPAGDLFVKVFINERSLPLAAHPNNQKNNFDLGLKYSIKTLHI
jgi:hypothetical protein